MNNAKEKLKIELKEYEYRCPDGCCYDYGTMVKVNGEETLCHNQDLESILTRVLEHLGYEVEIERIYDYD